MNPKKRGVIVSRRNGENPFRGPLENLRRGSAVLGRSLRQLVLELLPEFSLPGAFVGHALDSFHDEFGRLVRKIEHHFGGIWRPFRAS